MISKGDPPGARRTEHRFVAFDKTPLFFQRIRSEAVPSKGSVLIVHGMGEHGGRYLPLARHLAGKGFSCALPDLRGFGQSGGKRGCLHRFSDYFSDLKVVCRLMSEWEQAPSGIFLMGHSFGGLIVSSFLAEHPGIRAKGLVLSSPNFGIALRVPRWRSALALLASRVLPDHTQDNRVDGALLTHDAEMMRKYKSDRLVHHLISARLYAELVARIAKTDEIASGLHLPALVLQAGDDRVVSKAATLRFFEKLRSDDKQIEVYENLYHEILNETSRQAIFDRISGWLLQRA